MSRLAKNSSSELLAHVRMHLLVTPKTQDEGPNSVGSPESPPQSQSDIFPFLLVALGVLHDMFDLVPLLYLRSLFDETTVSIAMQL